MTESSEGAVPGSAAAGAAVAVLGGGAGLAGAGLILGDGLGIGMQVVGVLFVIVGGVLLGKFVKEQRDA